MYVPARGYIRVFLDSPQGGVKSLAAPKPVSPLCGSLFCGFCVTRERKNRGLESAKCLILSSLTISLGKTKLFRFSVGKLSCAPAPKNHKGRKIFLGWGGALLGGWTDGRMGGGRMTGFVVVDRGFWSKLGGKFPAKN